MQRSCPRLFLGPRRAAFATHPRDRRSTHDAGASLVPGGAGLLALHLCAHWSGQEDGLWLPGLGLGLALVAWLGLAIVPLLALDLVLTRLGFASEHPTIRLVADGVLLAAEMGLSWWVYAHLARGSRRLEDPRSATVFLILVPGAVAAAMASIQALYWGWTAGPDGTFLDAGRRFVDQQGTGDLDAWRRRSWWW